MGRDDGDDVGNSIEGLGNVKNAWSGTRPRS